MRLNTASQIISFIANLEEDLARFYEDLSQQYKGNRESLLSFAEENRRNVAQIQKAYYGTISDALEGCFTFNMDPDDYSTKTGPTKESSHRSILEKAIEMEENIVKFYVDAAEQSQSLLADIPRSFKAVARKKAERMSRLRTLLDE